jgi:hypothetical protein
MDGLFFTTARRHRVFALVALVIASGLTACQSPSVGDERSPAGMSVRERVAAGKALLDRRCSDPSRITIHRVVENVDGIVLLKVRPDHGDAVLSNPMWEGAALPLEYTGNSYITSFLGYEHSSSQQPVSPTSRGYINPEYSARNPSNEPGYQFVDVRDEASDTWWRYTGAMRPDGTMDITAPAVQAQLRRNPDADLTIYRWKLSKTPSPPQKARFAVTYEEPIVQEERALGLATTVIKVIDLATGEVMASMGAYAWTLARPSNADPVPWLTSSRCGGGFRAGAGTTTRLFVDQVLKPSKGHR